MAAGRMETKHGGQLKVTIVFDERKCSNQERFLYRRWIFNVILAAGCFYIICENCQNEDDVLHNTINFETVSIILETFFTIPVACDIYGNTQ